MQVCNGGKAVGMIGDQNCESVNNVISIFPEQRRCSVMKYQQCESDILTALEAVRSKDTIIPRWRIEEEVSTNPERYPGAALINILEISFNIYRNFKNYVVQFGFSLNGLNQFV